MLKIVLVAFVATLAACSANSNSDVESHNASERKCTSPHADVFDRATIVDGKITVTLSLGRYSPEIELVKSNSSIEGIDGEPTALYSGELSEDMKGRFQFVIGPKLFAQLNGNKLALSSSLGERAVLICR